MRTTQGFCSLDGPCIIIVEELFHFPPFLHGVNKQIIIYQSNFHGVPALDIIFVHRAPRNRVRKHVFVSRSMGVSVEPWAGQSEGSGPFPIHVVSGHLQSPRLPSRRRRLLVILTQRITFIFVDPFKNNQVNNTSKPGFLLKSIKCRRLPCHTESKHPLDALNGTSVHVYSYNNQRITHHHNRRACHSAAHTDPPMTRRDIERWRHNSGGFSR